MSNKILSLMGYEFNDEPFNCDLASIEIDEKTIPYHLSIEFMKPIGQCDTIIDDLQGELNITGTISIPDTNFLFDHDIREADEGTFLDINETAYFYIGEELQGEKYFIFIDREKLVATLHGNQQEEIGAIESSSEEGIYKGIDEVFKDYRLVDSRILSGAEARVYKRK